jgi:hypothetical protein
MYGETINNGLRYTVSITHVDCVIKPGMAKLYFRDEQRKVHHVNVPYRFCKSFKVGDSVSVFINLDSDWYEIDPMSLKEVSP